MAAGWVHATMDLMAFGRSYFDLHKYKDHPWKKFGYKHRQVYHDWYNEFGKSWNLDEPFPLVIHMRTDAIADLDKAEQFQSWIAHDYLDKIWDTLNPSQRKNIERAFKWLLENPEDLNRIYEIDIFRGLIYRVVDRKSVVERCPELIGEYKRLRSYVAKINLNNAGD